MDACIFMSTLTIKTILLIIFKPNAYYAGACSLKTMQLNSVTSKVKPIHLLTHFLVFPLMRGRILQIATITQAISVMLQAKNKLESFTSLIDNDDLIDLFVHLPLLENVPFVLDYQSIAQVQTGDAHLQQLHNCTPAKFQQQLLALNISIWCFTVDPNQQWKIYLPDALLEHAI
jgi:hypothetical protein